MTRGARSGWTVLVAAGLGLLAAPLGHAAGLGDRDTGWNPPPLVELPPGEVLPTAQELEARGAKVGRILVRVYEIFDTTDPRENTALYRLANRLHIRTRDSAVLAQLTFLPGETVSVAKLRESARILRDRRYVFDAVVRPARYDPASNTVDIEVSAQDVWTLNPGLSYGRSGGQSTSSFELQDENFLGRGKNLQFRHENNVDRSTTSVDWDDPNVMGSRWALSLQAGDLSDGHTYWIDLERPFYSLTTRHGGGLQLLDDDRETPRYELGHEIDSFREQRKFGEVHYGWSDGLVDGVTHRWSTGVTYDQQQFATLPGVTLVGALPADREFVYPWIQYERLADAFTEARNQNQIGRTEDLYLGARVRLRAGFAPRAFGSTSDSLLLSGNYFRGVRLSDTRRYEFGTSLDGRLDEGKVRDTVLSSELRFYRQISRKQLFYASLSGAVTEELSADRQLLLGGDNGLRGYPLRFQSGRSRALLTVEDRIFTDWYPFRLFNIGGAVFFDVGRTWGRSFTGAEPLGVLKDAGFGLRIGNSRSGLGSVLHVDFAWALDAPPGEKSFQILVETRRSF